MAIVSRLSPNTVIDSPPHNAALPKTNLFYVPTNHVCMDYEPFRVTYTPGQPYVGATLSMYPAPGSHGGMGNFIAWDGVNGKIKWSNPEQFSAWGGALATAGDVVFYGTLEGYLKAVDSKSGKELYKFKTLGSLRRLGRRDAREPGPVNHISLGSHCHTAQILKTLGLRTWSAAA